MQTGRENSSGPGAQIPFPEFLDRFKKSLHRAFHAQNDINQLSLQRGLPPAVLEEIMACNPLSAYIPAAYGGRGGQIREGLALTSAAAYESLALSLVFGINWALFLQPVAKYGQEAAKAAVFADFLQHRRMGGLMITEPDYGSDALHMQTSYSAENGLYHLQGTKHWAGLTGMADYWLLTAREKTADGDLKRDIDFFICDANEPEQHIVVEELFENLGLYMIPYGRNRVDLKIPKPYRLVPHSSGIKMMLDILHRSRLQFPGMATGFVQRMLDEALTHCRERLVGSKPLIEYDQVQQRLSRLQGAFTVCSAMCHHSSSRADPAVDLAPYGLEANSVKTVVTDLMQDAAQSLLQLFGAKGYRMDHIAGRSLVDSRPFQIFEGSNDILYVQITETILKLMNKTREYNLFKVLSSHDLTRRPADRLKKLLDLELQPQLVQRKLVEIGRVVSRIIAMGFVLDLGNDGFRSDLVKNSLTMLQQEIAGQIGAFIGGDPAVVVEEYREGGGWFDLAGEPGSGG